MLEIFRGQVKFFNRDKGFGFITPEKPGRDVFFHVDHFSDVTENSYGILELDFDPESGYKTPERGDKIHYNEYENTKGLMAIRWTFSEAYDKAAKIVSERPRPHNPKVRVARPSQDPVKKFEPIPIWEGWYFDFLEKLDKKEFDFSNPSVFVGVYAEVFLAYDAWVRLPHPRDWHQSYR